MPFPAIPPIAGVELATGRAGLYKQVRDDVLMMRFAEGTTAAGVFTRHGVGSAPVDWCKRHLLATGGENVRGLVVNSGCANSFTGRPGGGRRAPGRRGGGQAAGLPPARRDAGLHRVIGVLLDDAKIAARLPEIDSRLHADNWAAAARAIMTTDTFPKGAWAEAEIDGIPVRIAGIAKGSGMIAPDMATMLAFIATDAAISPAALQNLVALYTRPPSTA